MQITIATTFEKPTKFQYTIVNPIGIVFGSHNLQRHVHTFHFVMHMLSNLQLIEFSSSCDSVTHNITHIYHNDVRAKNATES